MPGSPRSRAIEPSARPALHFDDIVFSLQPHGGITTYWRELTQRIAAMGRFDILRTRAGRWQRLSRVSTSARVFHSSYFRIPRADGVKSVVTVHDLGFESGLIRGALNPLSLFIRRRAIERASAIVCVSENTKRELLQRYPALAGHPFVRVIHHGCGSSAMTGDRQPPATVPIDGAFGLFVGTRVAYKNFAAALHGFARARAREMKLACVGPPFTRAEKEMIARLGLRERVLHVQNVDDALLGALYRSAAYLAYPSSSEGFGFPIVEAMAAGCPVIALAASAVPEIAGGAAELLRDVEPDSVAAAMDRVLEPSVRASLARRGESNAARFSWDASAQAHAELYRQLAGS
jgi:mannosyltransferase